jgi:hypothetical protein
VSRVTGPHVLCTKGNHRDADLIDYIGKQMESWAMAGSCSGVDLCRSSLAHGGNVGLLAAAAVTRVCLTRSVTPTHDPTTICSQRQKPPRARRPLAWRHPLATVSAGGCGFVIVALSRHGTERAIGLAVGYSKFVGSMTLCALGYTQICDRKLHSPP